MDFIEALEEMKDGLEVACTKGVLCGDRYRLNDGAIELMYIICHKGEESEYWIASKATINDAYNCEFRIVEDGDTHDKKLGFVDCPIYRLDAWLYFDMPEVAGIDLENAVSHTNFIGYVYADGSVSVEPRRKMDDTTPAEWPVYVRFAKGAE